MGKITENLDWLDDIEEEELHKFRKVWIRYERFFFTKINITKDVRIKNKLLKHEWILTVEKHITLIEDDFQNFLCRDLPHRLQKNFYRAIVDDIKSMNAFRRTPEGMTLPKNKNKLYQVIKELGYAV
jgi:hypothetical protein